MKNKFIELTDLYGERLSVRVGSIDAVEVFVEDEDGENITKVYIRGNYFKVAESYDTVVKLILDEEKEDGDHE